MSPTNLQPLTREPKNYLSPPIPWRRLYPAWVEDETVYIKISRDITLEGFVIQSEPELVLFDWGGIRYEASRNKILSKTKYQL